MAPAPRVHEVMTPHAEWIAPSPTVTEAARRTRDHKIGCVPVGQNDRAAARVAARHLLRLRDTS